MTVIGLVPALIAALGLVVYFATNGKASTAGLWTFGVGLLVFLMVVARHVIRIG